MRLPLGEYWTTQKLEDGREVTADGTIYRRTKNGELRKVGKVRRQVSRERLREQQLEAREKRVQAGIRTATTKHAERRAKARMRASRREREALRSVRKLAVALALFLLLFGAGVALAQEVRYTSGEQLACDDPGHVVEIERLRAEESKRQYGVAGALLVEGHCRVLADSTRVLAFPTRSEEVVRIELAESQDTASYYVAVAGLR